MLSTVLAVIAVSAWLGALWVVLRRLTPQQVAQGGPQESFRGLVEAQGVRLAELDAAVAGMSAKVEGFQKEATNAAERARYHAKRAQDVVDEIREFADSGDDVPVLDGERGGAEGVYPMRARVEAGPEGSDEVHVPDPFTLAGLG